MTQQTLWIDAKKKLPEHNDWVLVLCDKKYINEGDDYIFIAKPRTTMGADFTEWVWRSWNGNYYSQSAVVGWMEIPSWRIEKMIETDRSKALSRCQILDFS